MKASELDKKVSDFYDALIAECRPMSYGIAYEAGYRAALEDVEKALEAKAEDSNCYVYMPNVYKMCTIEEDDEKEQP